MSLRPVVVVALALLGVPASTSAASQTPGPGPVVLWHSTIGAPVEVPDHFCAGAAEGVRSEAMPLIGVDPDDDRVVQATWSAHGERLLMTGRSSDGGWTWAAEAVGDATSCSGGPSSRYMATNTLFDVGAGGAGYVGESWFSAFGAPVFEYGVAVHRTGSGRPGGEPVAGDVSSQNAAVAASPEGPDHVAVAWTYLHQVPNPFTYTPLPNQIRFAESRDGGQSWSDHVVVHEAPPGELVVNPRLVRTSDKGLVMLFDRGRLADFPGAQLHLNAAEFSFFALRSDDDGATWSQPTLLGTGEFYSAQRPDDGPSPQLIAVKPDLAAGPDGTVVAAWHDRSRTTVRIARSRDGGRTWADAEDTVALDGLPYQVAVAVDGRGVTGLSWYDFRDDHEGDEPWTVRPFVAAQGADGHWRETALDEGFDLGAAQSCDDGALPPFTTACDPASHAGPLGVQQDLEGLSRGFAASYTVAGHLARDGWTDVRFARVAVPDAGQMSGAGVDQP